MSCREYYTCKNCGFTYTEVNYYFCFRTDTGLIEKYESLFSTMNYADKSPVKGQVMQHYCKNCDKIVSIYQTGLGSSIFTREPTIDFLMEFIPKKEEKLLKTSVLLKNLVELVESDASLTELNDFLEEHDENLYYKLDLNDYLCEKSFKSMGFDIKDYIKEKGILDSSEETLNDAHSNDIDLKSLYKDMSNHLKNLSASDLNRKEFYRDISEKFDYLSDDLREFKNEIICINYYGDDFNISLDGDEIDSGICPECGEEFYVISPENPCPKCGSHDMDYDYVLFD